MMKFCLKLLVGWLLVVLGYLFGVYISDAEMKREVKLCDSIVFDTIFCKSNHENELLIRIALLDFLSSGGKHPLEDTSSQVLLLHLKSRSSVGEIESYFNQEFKRIDFIGQENFTVKEGNKAVFMIAGISPFLKEDCIGMLDCEVFIKSIEDKFLKYVFSYR